MQTEIPVNGIIWKAKRILSLRYSALQHQNSRDRQLLITKHFCVPEEGIPWYVSVSSHYYGFMLTIMKIDAFIKIIEMREFIR